MDVHKLPKTFQSLTFKEWFKQPLAGWVGQNERA
jgi:hypothetical protein